METPEQFLDELQHITTPVPIEGGILIQATILLCKQAHSNQTLRKELHDRNNEIKLLKDNLFLLKNRHIEQEERLVRMEKKLEEKDARIDALLKRPLSVSIEYVK
jgi:hypothetical protein